MAAAETIACAMLQPTSIQVDTGSVYCRCGVPWHQTMIQPMYAMQAINSGRCIDRPISWTVLAGSGQIPSK